MDALDAGFQGPAGVPVADEQAAGDGKALHLGQAEPLPHAANGFLRTVGLAPVFHNHLTGQLQGFHAGAVRGLSRDGA